MVLGWVPTMPATMAAGRLWRVIGGGGRWCMAVDGHGGGGDEPNEHAVWVHIFLRLWASANRRMEGGMFFCVGMDMMVVVVVVDALHG